MEDSDVGNQETIPGLNMPNGFQGKVIFCLSMSLSIQFFVAQMLLLNHFLVLGASIFCKKRGKNLFIRSKPDFQDCLNRYVMAKRSVYWLLHNILLPQEINLGS